MSVQEKSYTKLDGLLRNIDSKIEVDSTSKVVQISRYARDWEDVAEEIKKLKSGNSVLRTQIDGLEAENADLQKRVEDQRVIIVMHEDVNTQLRERIAVQARLLANATKPAFSHAALLSLCDERGKRIAELESQLNRLSAADHCIAHTDESIKSILGENQTLAAQNKELKSEVAAALSLIRECVEKMLFSEEEDRSTSKTLHSRMVDALSTPTGSKLLAKIEAGEKMEKAIIATLDAATIESCASALDASLSAYRAACEGGGE